MAKRDIGEVTTSVMDEMFTRGARKKPEPLTDETLEHLTDEISDALTSKTDAGNGVIYAVPVPTDRDVLRKRVGDLVSTKMATVSLRLPEGLYVWIDRYIQACKLAHGSAPLKQDIVTRGLHIAVLEVIASEENLSCLVQATEIPDRD